MHDASNYPKLILGDGGTVVVDIALTCIAGLGFAIWTILLFGRGEFWRFGERLEAERAVRDDWPDVAVVIPARNEAATIAQVLVALSRQNYPGRVRITLVDDSSTDSTAQRAAEAMVTEGPEFSIVTGAPLPDGWKGKLWALHQGVRHALAMLPSAKYLLFVDGDIQVGPGTLTSLVARADREQRDLVSIMARLSSRRGWERLLIPPFVFFFAKLYPFAWTNDPHSRTAAAAGGCLLVRRTTLERVGGVAAIRSALIDDCSMAGLVKRAGGRIWLGHGPDVVSLRDYGGLSEIWMMVARSAYTELRHSGARLAAAMIGMAVTYVVPPALVVGFPWHHNASATVLALAATMAMIAAYRPATRYFGLGEAWAATLPVAALFYILMTLDSARRHWLGRGGEWKGRRYGAARTTSSTGPSRA